MTVEENRDPAEPLVLAGDDASGDVVKEVITAAGQRQFVSLPTAGEANEPTSSFQDLLREVAKARRTEAAQCTMREVLGD